MNAAEQFKSKKYVYLSNTLTKEVCQKLTSHMFELHRAGKTFKDEPCPLSDSIYGDEVFDSILNNLAGPLSKQLGIELLPSYSYARIYRPGEILVKHKDRPSCEISGTMTLGFDDESELWPIFVSEDNEDDVGMPVHIGIGDLLMYYGNEINHWRPQYKGNWHVQLFFHYVDKNGDKSEWANDKREMANPGLHSKIIENGMMIRTCDDVFPGAATYNSRFRSEFTFNQEECKKAISLKEVIYPAKSTIGNGVDQGVYNPNIRSVDTYEIDYSDKTRWIFQKIATAVGAINSEYFKYDLLGIVHSLQLLHYKSEEKGHYDWHVDVGSGYSATRKISVSIPLSDRASYEGGDLELNNNGNLLKAIDEQGSITFFPSFMVHRVTPVTKGERWAIVVWIHGPNRFR